MDILVLVLYTVNQLSTSSFTTLCVTWNYVVSVLERPQRNLWRRLRRRVSVRQLFRQPFHRILQRRHLREQLLNHP